MCFLSMCACVCVCVQLTAGSWWARFFEYILFNLTLAFLCSWTLYMISPAASGSGDTTRSTHKIDLVTHTHTHTHKMQRIGPLRFACRRVPT